MKHLHLQFIVSSIALGLSGVFLFGATWNIQAMPPSDWTPLRIYASALLSALIGVILLAYGWSGVRHEMNRKK